MATGTEPCVGTGAPLKRLAPLTEGPGEPRAGLLLRWGC